MVGFQKFCNHTLLRPWVTPQFLAKWKVSWRYIILVSLISMVLVVAKWWIFKCYFRNRKVDFRVLLGGFWGITPPNTVRFFWNLDRSCSAKQSVICNSVFCIVLKIPGNELKNNFLAFFQRFFDHTVLCFMVHAPILWQMKGLMVIHNGSKFHQNSICGSKFMNFEMFLWRCSSLEMGLFGGFLGPFSPKSDLNLLKFGPEVIHDSVWTKF